MEEPSTDEEANECTESKGLQGNGNKISNGASYRGRDDEVPYGGEVKSQVARKRALEYGLVARAQTTVCNQVKRHHHRSRVPAGRR